MAVPGVQVTVDDVGIKSSANTVKIDGTTNTVKIDSSVNTVKIDGTDNTVQVAGTPSVFDDTYMGWFAYDTDTNAVATATKALEEGKEHLVQVIMGGYSDGTVAGTLTLKFGTEVQFVYPVFGSAQILLPSAVVGTAGAAVSAELSAGGESKVGYVTIMGRSRPAPPPGP